MLLYKFETGVIYIYFIHAQCASNNARFAIMYTGGRGVHTYPYNQVLHSMLAVQSNGGVKPFSSFIL